MNNEFFAYKSRFLTFLLLLGYTLLRFKLTVIYADANLDGYIHLNIRLPFGQRMLVPALAHLFSIFLPLKAVVAFFLLEWLFITLFYFSLKKLLEYAFSSSEATLLSWLFLLLLPLITIINYRFKSEGLSAPFYFPYDTASLFFMSAGYLWCLKKQWTYFVPLVFLATFNRESSVLLILMIPALHWQELRNIIKPVIASLLGFILARSLIIFLVHDFPGSFMEYTYSPTNETLLERNFYILLVRQELFYFLFCFAGLPVFWFVFYDYIPLRYRPLRYVALLYFMGLLLVGNFIEARIFLEIVVMLYLPVCIAVKRWLMEQPTLTGPEITITSLINRYAILATLTLLLVFRFPLINAVSWLTH